MVVAVIGMGRTEHILDCRIVLGLLIGIANQQTYRTTRGTPFEYPGKDFHLIRLLALGGVPAGTRLAPIQIQLQVGSTQLQPRRTAIDNGDQRRTMTFASSCDSKQGAQGVSGHACHPSRISEASSITPVRHR